MDIYEYEEPDYQRIKREYENAVDYKLLEWALPYFNGTKKTNGKDFYTICTIPVRAAIDIERLTGREVYNFQQVLRCDEVLHIAKRHGKKGKADHFMEDIHDLARIKYVIDNYDEIIYSDGNSRGLHDKNNNKAINLLFVKRINGYVIVAQAITDSKRQNNLYIQSMYKAKTSAYFQAKKIHEEKMLKNDTKKECAAFAQLNSCLLPNVRNEHTHYDSILPQSEENVNSFYESSSEQKTAQKKECTVDNQSSRPNVQDECTPNTSILPQNDKNVNSFMKNFSNRQTKNKSNDNDGFGM